jgi:hypothetical protein
MSNNRGFAQIPLMISLLVLTIALPVLSRVVKNNQDTRNRATEEPLCEIVPPDFVAESGECSSTRGCARTLLSDPLGPKLCKEDCSCPLVIEGDNSLCGTCDVVLPPVEPTLLPTTPESSPSATPPAEPTVIPTEIPSIIPTIEPTIEPTVIPTEIPTVIPTLIPTATPTIIPTPTKVECDVCSSNFGCLEVHFTGDKCFGVLHEDGTQKYTRRCSCGPKDGFGGGDDSECGTCWGIGDCGNENEKCCVNDDGSKKCDAGLVCDSERDRCIKCDMPVIEDYFDVKFDSMIPEVDILFAFDTTGSMGSLINMAKSKGLDLLEELDKKLGSKARFGMVDFRDYPISPYGIKGDYPYKLNVPLTDKKTDVVNGIKALTLGNGGDVEESYLRVMYESYSDNNIVWRKDAKKIVVFLADSTAHDPDMGRDEKLNTADDLTAKQVAAYFKENGMSLLYINVNPTNLKVTTYWNGIAKQVGNGSGAYGSSSITTSSVDFVDKIMDLILGVVRKIDVVELKVTPEKYQSWLEYDGSVGITVPMVGTDLRFPYKVKPADVFSGVYEFNIDFIGDKTKYAHKIQTVIVKCGSPTLIPTPTLAPIICGGLDQKCCLDYKGDKFCDRDLICDLDESLCRVACPRCKSIGDYNCDGKVNGLDYSWWKQEFIDKVQHDGKWEASHICKTVSSEDYSVWRYNYLK